MHQMNKEKTIFMTNCANFYYEIMSFNLKSVVHLAKTDGSNLERNAQSEYQDTCYNL